MSTGALFVLELDIRGPGSRLTGMDCMDDMDSMDGGSGAGDGRGSARTWGQVVTPGTAL
jgi:hypothetical protein